MPKMKSHGGISKNREFFKKTSQRKRHYTGAVGRNIKCLWKDRIQMENRKQYAGYQYSCGYCRLL